MTKEFAVKLHVLDEREELLCGMEKSFKDKGNRDELLKHLLLAWNIFEYQTQTKDEIEEEFLPNRKYGPIGGGN